MAQRGEHMGACVHETGEPLFHPVEGLRGFAHLGWPCHPQRIGLRSAAKPVGPHGKGAHRANDTPRGPPCHQCDSHRYQQRRQNGLRRPLQAGAVKQPAHVRPVAPASRIDSVSSTGSVCPAIIAWCSGRMVAGTPSGNGMAATDGA